MERLQKAEEGADLIPLDHAFDRPFADMSNLSNALKNVRIAVLIDDLDRCSPENLVSVLESINLIMDIPGFIFVLALDYDVLIKAVSSRYPHASGHVFIEKMVQVPFRVPRLDLQAEDFLMELVPGWRKRTYGFPKDFLGYINDIASLALEANPRQIKRLINSFLLLRRIVDQRSLEVENSLLAALIGLQLRWPEQYSDFAGAVFAGDANPYDLLHKDEDEPSLRQYAERFFSQPASIDKLRQLLQLTQTVTPQEYEQESVQPTDMTVVRETNREWLISELYSLGFSPSRRKENAYYNRQVPSTRFVMGKHYFRIEKKHKDGRFHLAESFLLTRDSAEAREAMMKAASGLASKSSESTLPYPETP